MLSDRNLIRLLLDHNADVAHRDCLPVELAVRRGDLSLVKLLVEADGDGATGFGDVRSSARPRKRPRLSDRVVISQRLVGVAISTGAQDIVRYFTEEKGESRLPPRLDHV